MAGWLPSFIKVLSLPALASAASLIHGGDVIHTEGTYLTKVESISHTNIF
jgi:hypothetical protein